MMTKQFEGKVAPVTGASQGFLFDQRTDKPQLAFGMITQFTVHERKEYKV